MRSKDMRQYEAVRERVGLFELTSRGKAAATGPDRVSFLHAMISNDVERLPEMQGRYATLLTAQGKIVSDLYVYKLRDQVLLDLEAEALAKTVDTLRRYIIMDDVDLRDVSPQWAHLSLQGPLSAGLVQDALGVAPPTEELALVEALWSGTPLLVAAKADYADIGFEVMFPSAIREDLAAVLLDEGRDRGLERMQEPAKELLRIEAGIPVMGRELDATRYPMEAGLQRALSFDKGCYIGQEVVAKATYIGGVSRRLVQLRVDAEEPLPEGAALRSEDGKTVGSITSCAYSPRLGSVVALGYCRKKFAEPGQKLLAVRPEGGESTARVADRLAVHS